MPKRLKKISSEVIHENPRWIYKHDVFMLPSGKSADYYYGEKTGVVIVIPVEDDGKLVLVRRLRHLQDKISLEFPMGGLQKDESVLDAAKRELLRCTGYQCEELINVGIFEPLSGLFKNTVHVFVASGLKQVQEVSSDEGIEIVPRRPDELEDIFKRGEVWDGGTLAAWSLARYNL